MQLIVRSLIAAALLVFASVAVAQSDPLPSWNDGAAKTAVGGALAGPVTAYQYDWNMLPIGQALWLKHLETYVDFPPLQNPASYNLDQVMQQVKEMKTSSHAGE